MRVDTTRQPLGVVLATLLVLLILFWGRALLFPLALEQSPVWLSPLGEVFAGFGDSYAGNIASLFLVFVNGLIITRIGTKNMLYTAKTYVPFIFYAIPACGVFVSSQSFNILLASLFVLVGLDIFISGFHRERNTGNCFIGGISIGVGVLIYTPFFVLLPILPFVMMLFFRDVRESITALLGFLAPVFGMSYVEWGMGGDFLSTANGVIYYFVTPALVPLSVSALALASGFIFAMLILLTTLSVGALAASQHMIRTRPLRISIAATLMLLAFVVLLLMPCSTAAVVQMVAIPMAILVPHFFVRYSSMTSLLLYILLIVSVIMINVVRII